MRNLAIACLIAGLATTPLLVAGCNASANVAAGLPDMKTLYTVGRKWEYLMTGGAGGQSNSQVQTWEVTKVDGNKATLKITTAGASSESTIDLTDSNVYAKLGGQGQAGGTMPAGTEVNVASSIAEKITVKAGAYDTTKVVSTVKTTQGMTAETTSTTWISKDVGLVKMEAKTKLSGMPAMPAGMPAMPAGMPAAMGDITTGLELQSFK